MLILGIPIKTRKKSRKGNYGDKHTSLKID